MRIKTSTIICYALLAAALLASLALRIAVPWEHVFTGQWIKLTDNDAYLYARLLDNVSRHFPAIGSPDPYLSPGQELFPSIRPMFFVHLMGFIALIAGAGAPAQQTVDLVAVYFPAIAGALLVIPVFLIGRTLFNRWAGLVAAWFIALMPGEFLARTLLGNADSHALEILLTTLFILFLLLAVREGQALTFPACLRQNRPRLIMTAAYSLLAGLCLGLYLLSWMGALLFIFVSLVWITMQAVADHLYGRPLWYLGLIGALAMITALAIVASANGLATLVPSLPSGPAVTALTATLALAFACMLPPMLAGLSGLLTRIKLNPGLYPLTVVVLAAAAMGILYVISPATFRSLPGIISSFFTWQTGASIAEMQPLLLESGSFTLALLWGNYTAASLLALVALAVILYQAVLRSQPGLVLLAVWTLISLLSALAMRRFAYYLAVPVAVLAGYTGWLMLQVCGLREEGLPSAAAEKPAKGKTRKVAARKAKARRAYNPAYITAGVIAVAFLVIYPNTGPLPGGDRPVFDVATRALYTPPDGWCQAMDWMREKTPQPYGRDEYYYADYGAEARSPGWKKPDPAYHVLCWWDYGYWVTRMAQRVPWSSPGTARRGEQDFYLAADEAEASRLAEGWAAGYVVTDSYMADWQKGFPTLCSTAGKNAGSYFEIYYRQQGDKLAPALLFYPEYYRTLLVRMQHFNGKAYTPAETAVMSWEQRTPASGSPYREITGLKTFTSYGEAQAFLDGRPAGNWRIVGKEPNVSPVPLEELKLYSPAFSSDEKVSVGKAETSSVKVFKRAGG